MRKSIVTAILGPTNTGKTYSAFKKLYNYKNGVIGFPLRLLARENYDLARNEFGERNVALITGEEKIIPSDPKYYFCTVESIPENIDFEFVAIDEVQLSADFERGYNFTEKIIKKKGLLETLFLGSNSMEPILKLMYPNINILKKPRLSKLSYCGYKNLSRLPQRSAVIAFSLVDVYEIANKIKQSFGGVSVVMGALSPEVRNAQVKLFEDGKVDHIVATDAIGLGLNLNIKNIFFSDIIKFDGLNKRILSYDEISQIAGRAGRYLNNGSFGVTGKLKSLGPELVSFIENYEYSQINKIYWRNSELDFRSPKFLLNSLKIKSKKNYFVTKRNASDQRYLRILLNDQLIINEVKTPKVLRILWDLCKIPDYSKDLDEFHSRFLKKIFIFLIKEQKIPEIWIKTQLKKIEKKTDKIPELSHKISQIRKWSFLSFKNEWIDNNEKFQHKVKKIENSLSINLHNQLISEFIGEFKTFETSIQKKGIFQNLKDNKIIFGKQEIGETKGFLINLKISFTKNKKNFAAKILKGYLKQLAKEKTEEFVSQNFDKLHFTADGNIYWQKNLIGQFYKGQEIINPVIKLFSDDIFEEHKKKIEKKLTEYKNFIIQNNLKFYKNFEEKNDFSKFFRAIKFSLLENLGQCKKESLVNYFNNLTKEETTFLEQNGLKNGFFFFFFESDKSNEAKQMFTNVFFKINTKSYLKKRIYFLKESIPKSRLKIFEIMGFYLIKLGNRRILVDFEYLEILEKRKRLIKNKSLTKLSNFEKIYFNNSNKQSFF
ncbi:MAG: hypothetical protein CNE97_04670 [alpha proteobacterium MED-G10]|nr:MAG: hypothetical protein CNE97_04670 [alpha proteobacterium MED-G10]